ncbi:zinc finger BED domain-containing protein RICESLEEPER 2-like [Senna tora]|uniref:Zinc finger BED domain-containing protein RICESLEEPER 2-like n=1 Tax=Senna tora TaxID=362788 RepID=A0A834WCL7_9FABA|nr:zinc finger BED domain-containing protein RICESLEEPER 2-like [Senna tora]
MSEFKNEVEETGELGNEEASSKRSRICTSAAWDQFEKILCQDGSEKAKCKICGKMYKLGYGTSNLIRHVSRCIFHGDDNDNVSSHLPLDQDKYREMVAKLVIKHDCPFSFVEHEGFRDLINFLNPRAHTISRNTLKADILKLYAKEKDHLKHCLSLVPGRISITSDLWSSISTDEYMMVTAHYIDYEWNLQKKVLSFTHVPPPRTGALLAERLFGLLKEWGIEKKIFSITLDNAAYNDEFGCFLPCTSDFFHIRCGAHILNLIVQEGLKVIDPALLKIRESVKYVKGSEIRKVRFATCLSQLSCLTSKKVCQDVPTRWNSTYLMLESALSFREAFAHLSEIDSNFKSCPSDAEWDMVERISKFLKPFYEITTLFSSTKYPTTNLFFLGVWRIQLRIIEVVNQSNIGSDDLIFRMTMHMKVKFDKYWDSYSMVLSLAIILDPRYKLQLVEYCFRKIYGSNSANKVLEIRNKLYLLYNEYLSSSKFTSQSILATNSNSQGQLDGTDDLQGFDIFESQLFDPPKAKSQLDSYLEEKRIPYKQYPELDVLEFWKSNQHRYNELSLMARDILTVPITTFASELSFDIGGHILDKYRSCLLPGNVEAILCTQNWLSSEPNTFVSEVIAGSMESTATTEKSILLSMSSTISGLQISFCNSLASSFSTSDLSGESRVEVIESSVPHSEPAILKGLSLFQVIFCEKRCRMVYMEAEVVSIINIHLSNHFQAESALDGSHLTWIGTGLPYWEMGIGNCEQPQLNNTDLN